MPHRFLEMLAGSRRRPAIVAHRGDSFHAPENTLEAARMAYEAGAEAWEFDVQLTRDGVPILLHDSSLRRTTDVASRFASDPRAGADFPVGEFDLEEIRQLDAGSWFVDPRGGPRSAAWFGTLGALEPRLAGRFASGTVRIPTLSEALTLTVELDWLANVEIKSFPDRPPGLLEAVLQTIAATGSAGQVLVSSFDHRELARVTLLEQGGGRSPELPRGALLGTPLRRPETYVRDILGADTLHLSADCLGASSMSYRRQPSPAALDGEVVAASARNGIPVLVYTVNDSGPGALAGHLHAIGVAGLFTDNPGGLRRSLE
jgi:glycerophosphoryl diester phosphodiesterase